MNVPSSASVSTQLKRRHIYQFGRFRLEPAERTLLLDNQRVELRGGEKAFDLLVLLVKNSPLLVERAKIVKEVWPDTHPEENAIDVLVSHIRKVVGQQYIETVPKHGYRFKAEVIESSQDVGRVPVGSQRRWIRPAFVGFGITLAFAAGYWWVHYLSSHSAPKRDSPAVQLYQQALGYERAGDDEQALATLDQTLEADPDYKIACVRAAYIANELEESTRARSYLARCESAEIKDEALRLKAQALGEALAGNSIRAMELYQLLIDRYPGDADGLFRFAELATDLDRVDAAEKAVRACLALQPEDLYCHFQLMYVDLKENKFDDILSEYKALPPDLEAYPWFDEPIGFALLGKDAPAEATLAFERLSSRQQKFHGTSHFTVGKEGVADVWLYLGRINDATRRIEQLMATADNESVRGDYLAYLAQIYRLLDDRRQAARFAKEVESAPAEAGSFTKAAIVLAGLGDSEGAERLLKARAQLTHTTLSANNEHLVRGVLAVAKGEHATGIEEIRLAYDFNPKDEEAVYQLGTAYFHVGDYGAALRMFLELDNLRGTLLLDNVPLILPLTRYRLAECYEHLGNPEKAMSYYAQVAKLWATADKELQQKYPTRVRAR